MNTPYTLEGNAPSRIVYIKPVAVSDLPVDVQSQLTEYEEIYALHAPDGEQLALVADKVQAFALARHNDFAPVSVH